MLARPVSSHRILACRDTLAAAMLTQSAGMDPEVPAAVLDTAGLPPTVSVKVFVAPDRTALPLRALDLDELHDQALASAWADGAWDLRVSCLPPLAGGQLGLVTAFVDYDIDPGLCDILVEAAERGRLVAWQWLPMRSGPEGRRRSHAAKDSSLLPDGGRAGGPPPSIPRPDPSWPESRDWLIRLGAWSEAHRPKPRRPYSPPATSRQRACIAALQYALGARHPDMPAALSIREASGLIDDLRRRLGET